MQREIKFRGWDNINKKMYYPKDLFNLQGFFYEDDTEGELCGNQIIDSYGGRNRFVLLQYTGLKDKNGKEIYEGDIVKYQYATYEHDIRDASGEVFFEDGMFLFDREMKFATNDSNFIKESLEIIGNIFETA